MTVWEVSGGLLLAIALVGGAVPAQEKAVDPVGTEPKPAPTTFPAPESAPDEVMALKRRVAGFWLARVNRDFAGQYVFLEPRARARIAPQDYGRGGGVADFLAYQVEEAVIDGSFATVQVRVLVRPNHPLLVGQRLGPVATVLADRWIRVEGTWYRIEEGG